MTIDELQLIKSVLNRRHISDDETQFKALDIVSREIHLKRMNASVSKETEERRIGGIKSETDNTRVHREGTEDKGVSQK